MNTRHIHPLSTLLAAATVALACLGAAGSVRAASFDWSRIDDERLEDLFWICDLRSAREAMSAGDGAACVDLTDELKQRRFGGDFARLLAWWQAAKTAERARREPSPLEPAAYDEAALQAP